MGLLVVFAIFIILAVILIIIKEKNSSPTDSIIPIEQSNTKDEIRISMKEIPKKYLAYIPKEAFKSYLKAKDVDYIILKRDVYDEMIAKMKDREDKEYILNKTADINTKIRTAKRISHLDAIIFEGNRRLQIMRESADLIEGTDNIQTLIRRKKVLDEELDWFGRLEKEDCPYHLTGGVANKRNETDILFNKMLYRIVKNTVDDYLLKIDEHKTEISKKNYTIKTYEIIELAKISLIKYASNYLENETEISKQFSIIEDKFSMT